jgi:hypothetical protein
MRYTIPRLASKPLAHDYLVALEQQHLSISTHIQAAARRAIIILGGNLSEENITLHTSLFIGCLVQYLRCLR